MTQLHERAQLALDTILKKPTAGIPTWVILPMEHSIIERLAGAQTGDYRKHPVETYIASQRAFGVCMIDQFIPTNPLDMGDQGYEGSAHGATTGADQVVVNGMSIASPEDVCEHMERLVFPELQKQAREFDEDSRVRSLVAEERETQEILEPDILKVPYGCVRFPCFAYSTYGYVNFFQAYALYPDVMEKYFSLQADVAVKNNAAVARAYSEANLPPMIRLDHDIADSRGTLVNEKTLDAIWFPHFARSIEPVLKTNIRIIWHCDGNLMAMVPRLLDCGLHGFQGFQYEDGMDYERICRMKTREGEDLLIIAGVSVTRTLPFGTPGDVKREMEWLVEHGPRTGLFLGGSSSVAPGVPWENIRTFAEGLNHYRVQGRA